MNNKKRTKKNFKWQKEKNKNKKRKDLNRHFIKDTQMTIST